jgi:hypothetical protein
MEPEGFMILTVVPRAGENEALDAFLRMVEEKGYAVQVTNLNAEEYVRNPLKDESKGEAEFPQLSKGHIGLYEVRKRGGEEKKEETKAAELEKKVG